MMNGGIVNVINAIKLWAVATVRFGTGIIEWHKGKLLNMHRGLHPRSSVDRM